MLASAGARAEQFTAEYLTEALIAAQGDVDGDGLMNLWTGTVPVRFYERCDASIIGGAGKQTVAAKRLEYLVAELNELQSRIKLALSVVPCGAKVLPGDAANFGIAVVPGGGMAGVEHVVRPMQAGDGAASLLVSIRNGAPDQFDTGCTATAFYDSSDATYRAAMAYVDFKTVQFSPTKCVELTLLSALGFIGDMRKFPEAFMSHSNDTHGLSDLDRCVIASFYSDRVRAGMPVASFRASAPELVANTCEAQIAK